MFNNETNGLLCFNKTIKSNVKSDTNKQQAMVVAVIAISTNTKTHNYRNNSNSQINVQE